MKKILSMLLSLALVSASFVTAMAAKNPSASVVANPLDAETYEFVTECTIPEGHTPYEVVVSFDNLPDLTYGSKGSGTRFGAFTVKLFTDVSKIGDDVTGLNVAEKTDDWGAENYGVINIPQATIAKNTMDSSITLVKTASAAGDTFPYDAAGAALDANGTLANAVVFYMTAAEAPVFTSILTDAYVSPGKFADRYNTKATEFFAGVEGNVNSDDSYNVGVETSKVVTSEVTKAVFNFAGAADASYEVALPTAVSSGTVVVALNVTNVPAGVTFQFTGATIQ